MDRLYFCLIICFSGLVPQSRAQAPISENMELIGRWDSDTLPTLGVKYNDVWGYADCEGNEYAILGSARRIHFIQLNDGPREVASFPGGDNSIWRDFKTYYDRVYAVADQGSEGLLIFDMSGGPNSIRQSNQITQFFQRTHNIYIDEPNGRLYVAGSNTQNSGLIVLDISEDPDRPTLLSSVSLPGGGYVHDVFVRDNIAYCSHGFNGFYIWDFTDPANPQPLASIPTSGYNHSSWISDDGQRAIFAEEVPRGIPLGILDLSELQMGEVELINTFKFPLLAPDFVDNTPHNPFFVGDYAVVSYYEDGVVIFDLSDPRQPKRVAHYDTNPSNNSYNGTTNNWGVYPFLPSGKILASDTDFGLFVLQPQIDLGTPYSPYTSVKLSGPLTVCDGELLRMEVAGCRDCSYQWWVGNQPIAGAQQRFYEAAESGQYQLRVTTPGCTQQTEIISVDIRPEVNAQIEVHDGMSPEICEGNTLLLKTRIGAENYLWTRNGQQIGNNSATLEIDQQGVYGLTLQLNGCSAAADPLEVVEGLAPELIIEADANNAVCEGNPVELFSSVQADYYEWTRNGQFVESGAPQITVTESGTYQLSVRQGSCQYDSEAYELDLVESRKPTIAVFGNVISSTHGQSFQWYRNDQPISSATEQSYTFSESGTYFVVVTYDNGCSAPSNVLDLILSDVGEAADFTQLKLYPNPVRDILNLSFIAPDAEDLELQIFLNTGQLIYRQRLVNAAPLQIDCGDWPAGLYVMRMIGAKGNITRKFVKE